MSEFKLEKGIPLPASTRNRESKYPFAQMQVGDSFFIPNNKKGEPPKGLYTAAKHKGIRIAVRPEKNGKTDGVRVWRAADKPKRGPKPKAKAS